MKEMKLHESVMQGMLKRGNCKKCGGSLTAKDFSVAGPVNYECGLCGSVYKADGTEDIKYMRVRPTES